MDFNDGCVRVRRQPNERFSEVCVMEHDRYGGGISWTSKTLTVRIHGTLTAQRYVEDIVEPVVVPYFTVPYSHGNLLARQRKTTFCKLTPRRSPFLACTLA